MRQRRIVAALIAVLILPGGAELAIDTLHLLQTGHTEHEHDPPPEAEHGCSGPFHACGCCSSVPFAQAEAPAVVPVCQPESTPVPVTRGGPAPGFELAPFRPPTT